MPIVLIGFAAEVSTTKARIIPIEIMRMARDREAREIGLEQLRQRRDLADQADQDTPQQYS